MAGKKVLKSDAEVKAAVDDLLGAFGIVAEAEGDFADGAPPKLETGERHQPTPSGAPDALWGGKKK